MRTLLSIVLFLATLGFVGNLVWVRLPCAVPLTVSVGAVDPQFHIPAGEIASVMAEAKATWESVVGKPLFTIVANGDIPVNAVYDSRQQTAEQLKDLNSSIQATEDRRKEVKAKYDVLHADYEQKGAAFKQASAAYEADRQSLAQDIKDNPDLTPSQAVAFQRRSEALDDQFRSLTTEQLELSVIAGKINALVDEDSALVPAENNTIDNFNDVAHANGEEYETGLFTSGPEGRKIDLYVYEDRAQLLRLVMHEMGHALGLGHVDNKQAVMYRLNLSKVPVLDQSDKDAVVALCSQSDPREWPALLSDLWRSITGGTSSAPA